MPNQEEAKVSPNIQLATEPPPSEQEAKELVEAPHVESENPVIPQVIPQDFAPEENGNCASMDLAIQSEAISVSLRSRASLNPETIALSAQVRVLTDQLAQVSMKLDEANYKIGFLEGQMLAQREKAQELQKRLVESQSTKKGLIDWLRDRFSCGGKPSN